jgi:AcrR family transcriptional regulator
MGILESIQAPSVPRQPLRPGPLPRAERREAILRGAAAAFAMAGYAATSMEDIAAASGITKLIVYRHFDSKESLYRAVVQRVFERHAEELVDGLARQRPGFGPAALITVARESPDGFVLLWRHAAREPQFAAYAGELREQAVDVVRDALRSYAPDAPREWAAHAIFDFLVDATIDWLEHGDPDDDEGFVVHATGMLRAMVGALAI